MTPDELSRTVRESIGRRANQLHTATYKAEGELPERLRAGILRGSERLVGAVGHALDELPDSVMADVHRRAEGRRAAAHQAESELGSRIRAHATMQARYLPAKVLRTVLSPLSLPASVLDTLGETFGVEFGRWEQKRELTTFHFIDAKSSDDLNFIVDEMATVRDDLRELRESIDGFRFAFEADPPQEVPEWPSDGGLHELHDLDADVRTRLERVREARIERDVRQQMTSRLTQHLVAQGVALPGRLYVGLAFTLIVAPVAAVSVGAGAAVGVPLIVGGLAAGSVGDAVRTEVNRWEQKSDFTELFTVKDWVQGDTADLAAKVMSVRENIATLKEFVEEMRDTLGGRPPYITVPMTEDPVAPTVAETAPEVRAAKPVDLRVPRAVDHLLNQAYYLPSRVLFGCVDPPFLLVSGLSAAGDAVGVEQKREGRKAALERYQDLDLRKQIEIHRAGEIVNQYFQEYAELRDEAMELSQPVHGDRIPVQGHGSRIDALRSSIDQLEEAWPEPLDEATEALLHRGLHRVWMASPELHGYVERARDALAATGPDGGHAHLLHRKLENDLIALGMKEFGVKETQPRYKWLSEDADLFRGIARSAREVHKATQQPTSLVENVTGKVRHELAVRDLHVKEHGASRVTIDEAGNATPRCAAEMGLGDRVKAIMKGTAKGTSRWWSSPDKGESRDPSLPTGPSIPY